MSRPRVLFVAEAVTLAQIVRLAVLARALDPRRYEVHFASASFPEMVFRGAELRRWPIRSLPPETVERLVSAGKRPYDEATLSRYVGEERALIQRVRPSLVVGDLRLSLAVSAPLAGVPHAALINAYWSPHAVRDGFPLPDHPIVRLLGERTAAKYFPLALPRVFAHFARPVNALRRAHGLPEIGSLPEALTHGDLTLFPDVPELVPTRDAPAHHRYLGPVLWSAPVPLPGWWDRLDPRRPTAYVTLGSSGRADLVPLVIEALAGIGLQLLVATAGRAPLPSPLPPHVHAADYLPGAIAAARADLVVSNGGSTTGYQALSVGRPVLGIAWNLDQYLATTAIETAGAGLLVRAGRASVEGVRAAARRALEDTRLRRNAEALAATFARHDAAVVFAAVVETATSPLAGSSRRPAIAGDSLT